MMRNNTINGSNPAPLEIMNSVAGAMKLLLLCALALLFAISIIADNYIISGKAWVVSWILLPLSPIVFALLLWRLIKGGVQLRIDSQGILYPRWSDSLIRWEDIEHVSLTKAYANYQLGIRLSPSARSRYPKLDSIGASLRRKISRIDIPITVTGMACKPADIMLAIREHSGARY